MKYHEINPQTCDMGFSIGEYQIDKSINLRQALQELYGILNSWGTITIIYPNKDICRIFDYDLYNDTQFYHHLSGWVYNMKIDKITTKSCFMNKDLTIELTK